MKFLDLFRRCLTTSGTGLVGFCLVVFTLFVALAGPWLTPYAPNDSAAMYTAGANAWPDAAHWLGTDRQGYDVLSQTIYGAQTALLVGLGAVLVAGIAGIIVGGIAGYRGGWVDEILMRFTDFFLVIPIFIVILAVVRVLSKSVPGTPLEGLPYFNLLIIIAMIGVFGWAPIARMTRAEFMRIRNLEYIAAARCVGLPSHRIIFREILPNAMPSIIVLIALQVGAAILIEAMLSFLGFGDPASVSWGQMLHLNYQSLRIYPIASLVPGLMIFITVMGFNLLADGLAYAANPMGARARILQSRT
jgi:ABC-type dipeptide/oligopeptide/nickel transport system permease subunit